MSAEHFSCKNPFHNHGAVRPTRPQEAAQPAAADRFEQSPQAPVAVQGGSGVGDPYFPMLGNTGYDAKHYDVKMKVDPRQNHIVASNTMTAEATDTLSRFNLDFHGFDIAKITVNGQPASFEREDGELQITPAELLPAGSQFQVKVDYAGNPEGYHSPHAPIQIGWVGIPDGNYVLSEPDGAAHWLPVNDHPRDKATYDFDITVPQGFTAVANGELAARTESADGKEVNFQWKADDPMASYLATVNVGKFKEQRVEGPNGLLIHNFFPASIEKQAQHDFARVPDMISWFSERFGPYPFGVYGNLVLDASVGGAALETQTRPTYEKGMVTGDQSLEFIYAHELAHQWWGNSVTVNNWKDIWLNEGFANYSHMMWKHEHDGGFKKLDRAMKSMYAFLPRNSSPVSAPGEDDMFDENVYNRGACALHCLRKDLGDETFFNVLKTWAARGKEKPVTTDDLVKVASEVSGKDLAPFFDKWVNQRALPPWPGGLLGATEVAA